MKVHQALQRPVTLVLPYYDIMSVLQSINHEMSVAALSTEGYRRVNEQGRTLNCWTECVSANCKIKLFLILQTLTGMRACSQSCSH